MSELPANWHGQRCGHNFTVPECPYAGCITKDLYAALVAVSDMLFARPDIVAKLAPLMGPAEQAVCDVASAALAKARGES